MKKCSTCKQEKPVEAFNRKGAGWQPSCRECSRAWYRTNAIKHKAHVIENNRKYRARGRQFVFDYLLQHPCIDCQETDPVVLEFDHRDGVNKIDDIARMIRNGASLDSLQQEIAKCDVRCANCHRRRTAKQFGFFRLTQ